MEQRAIKSFFFSFFLWKGFPEKPVCYWEYQNPKDNITMIPLVPHGEQPHVILPGIYSFDCNYGPDCNKSNKHKWSERKSTKKDVDHSQTSCVAKVIIQQGHKVDCPAKICVIETFVLDEYNCLSTKCSN